MRQWVLCILIVLAAVSLGRAYTISGQVLDRDTQAPLEHVNVACFNQDLEEYLYTWTQPDGTYELEVNPGRSSLYALPDVVYARIGREIDVTGDLSGQDFLLFGEAVLSGRLVDFDTAESIADQEISYWNDLQHVWQQTYTDGNGYFQLTGLPPGIANVEPQPDAGLGYSNYPSTYVRTISLSEGQVRDNIWIALRKGALVTGQMVDINSNPMAGIAVDIIGRNGDAWLGTNLNGEFQGRMAPGTYLVRATWDDDADEPVGCIPVMVDIPDLSPLTVPTITVYSIATGRQISGTVNLTPGSTNTGQTGIAAFPAGTEIDPVSFYTTDPAVFVPVDPDGSFVVPALPPVPGRYDLYLLQVEEAQDELESYTILDGALNISTGTTDVSLSNDPGTISVTGSVQNPLGLPVFSARVFLEYETGLEPRLAGFADTDENGTFTLYNIHPGTYKYYVQHPKYSQTPATVPVSGSGAVDIGIEVVPFAGETEAGDLTGDGQVTIGDLAVMSAQWHDGGTADLNHSGTVDLDDLARWCEFWTWTALWLNE